MSATAALFSRRESTRRKQSSFRDTRNRTLLDDHLLPHSKEWIADHNIEMLMLDG